jgi:hypothetical protein
LTKAHLDVDERRFDVDERRLDVAGKRGKVAEDGLDVEGACGEIAEDSLRFAFGLRSRAVQITGPSVVLPLLAALASCVPPADAPPAQQPAPQPQPQPQPAQYAAAPTYAPAPAYPAQPYAPQPQPSYAPPPQPVAAPAPARPLLPPLLGTLAWQAEIRSVLAEDTLALTPDNQARVRGIPLVVDPDPFEINAYAKCDDQGAPSIVATEGLLEAIDAIAQTRATDELYGTRTYDQYTAAVIPNLAHLEKASAALPPGILPFNVLADPRRLSRAHEWFDEIVAFTFGHELSHHWLGHTGCAFGAPNLMGAVPSALARWGNGWVQWAETQADIEGTNDLLATGKARATATSTHAPQYRWTEEGAYALLDFFLRLETAAGPRSPVGKLVVGFLNTHPPSQTRIPVVQTTTSLWRAQHPG